MTVINTNMNALRAQNASRVANKALGTAIERLSSGKRINTAKDDAAGMAISTRMDTKVRSMTQAIRNANDGISVTQIADDALGEMANILVKIRELAIQAGSTTLTEVEREAIDVVSSEYVNQYNDIADRTKFNGQQLLRGGLDWPEPMVIQTGVEQGERLEILIPDLHGESYDLNFLRYYDVGDASEALGYVDYAIDVLADQRARIASVQNRLEASVNHLTSSFTNLTEAMSRIQDTDFAVESTKLATAQVLAQASTAMLAQANQNQQDVLNLLR